MNEPSVSNIPGCRPGLDLVGPWVFVNGCPSDSLLPGCLSWNHLYANWLVLLKLWELLCCAVIALSLFFTLLDHNLPILICMGRQVILDWQQCPKFVLGPCFSLTKSSGSSWCDPVGQHHKVATFSCLMSSFHDLLYDLHHQLSEPIWLLVSWCLVRYLKPIRLCKLLKFCWCKLPSLVCEYLDQREVAEVVCYQQVIMRPVLEDVSPRLLPWSA